MEEHEGFYLNSRQTPNTTAIVEFAKRIIRRIRSPKDVHRAMERIYSFFEPLNSRELVARRSVNSQVNERVREAALEGTSPRVRSRRIHASVFGERTSHELLQDRFVSAQLRCTDLSIMLMAVLRQHGVPCRLARIVNTKAGSQTAAVELELNGRHYNVLPRYVEDPREEAVSPGLIEPLDDPDLADFDFVVRSRDHFESGIDGRLLYRELERHGGRGIARSAFLEKVKKVSSS